MALIQETKKPLKTKLSCVHADEHSNLQEHMISNFQSVSHLLHNFLVLVDWENFCPGGGGRLGHQPRYAKIVALNFGNFGGKWNDLITFGCYLIIVYLHKVNVKVVQGKAVVFYFPRERNIFDFLPINSHQSNGNSPVPFGSFSNMALFLWSRTDLGLLLENWRHTPFVLSPGSLQWFDSLPDKLQIEILHFRKLIDTVYWNVPTCNPWDIIPFTRHDSSPHLIGFAKLFSQKSDSRLRN